MSFGDWELFKMLILGLRERQMSVEDEELATKNVRFTDSQLHEIHGRRQQQDGTDEPVRGTAEENLGRRGNENITHITVS